MSGNNGGQAFPIWTGGMDTSDTGMTLRDYFASQALFCVPTIAEKVYQNMETWEAKDYASEAYKIADAMIKERSQL